MSKQDPPKIDRLSRRKGRELALMALYAIDDLASMQQFQAIARFWTIFEHPQVWKALFDQKKKDEHPLEGPALWKIFEDLPLFPPTEKVPIIGRALVAKNYAQELLEGLVSEMSKIDNMISDSSQRWRIQRMPHVDLNILRLGAYEVLFRDDIPVAVAINEALELTRIYSSEKARKFIHGVLDNIRKTQS